MVESEARTEADIKQLEKRLAKQLSKAQSELRQLSQQEFACTADAMKAANRFENRQRFYQLTNLEILEHCHHAKSGRPRKDAQPAQCYYQIRAFLMPNQEAIATEQQRSGRFILATNVLDAQALSNDDMLRDYIAQQSTLARFSIPQRPAVFHIQCFPQL